MTPHDIRLQLLQAGYSPLPLNGKAPVLPNWPTRDFTNPSDIKLWATMYPGAQNTGILTRFTPALDIDILDPEAAEGAGQLVSDRYGEHGRILVRIGQPPKLAILFRTDTPFAKITANLIAPNGSAQKIEFLCDGQQVVVDGIHPDTRQPYRWPQGCIGDIKHDDLPAISADGAQELVDDIVELLTLEHGYRRKDEPKAKSIGNGHDPDGADWAAPSDLIDHDLLCAHAMKLIRSGMHPGAAVKMLHAQVSGLQGVDAERKQRRLDEISDIVSSAQRKIGASAPQQSDDLGEWDAGDDPGLIEPRAWLLGNQFCRGFVSSLFAAGGTGKTSLRLLQLISLATGRNLCGQHVFQQSRVLIVTLEDDDTELRRRVEAVRLHYRIDRSELKGWLFCKAVRRKKLAVIVGRQRQIGPLDKILREAIERRKPDLVCLDPFVKTHGLVENDNMDMDFVADLIATLAIDYKIAVDVPHHVHKGAITPGDADAGRGGSGLVDAARLTSTLCAMSEDEAKAFSISPEARKFYIRLDSAKANIADGKQAEWFHLVPEPLGNATERYPNGDTVQVAVPWTPPDTWAGLSNATLNAILDDIGCGPRDENGTPSGERYSGAPSAQERAAWQAVQRHAPDKSEKQCREIIRTWIKNGLLHSANYHSPSQRREIAGLCVDDTKRPGARTG